MLKAIVHPLLILAILTVSSFISQAVAQGAPSPAPTTTTAVQRDTSALQLLQKMATASGWQLDRATKDITVLATMTVASLDGTVHTDQITIKARASDAKVSVENRTTGASIARSGELAFYHDGKNIQTVPWLSMEHVYGSFIPFLLPFYYFNDPAREVVLKGDVDLSGTPGFVISTRQVDSEAGVLADLRRRASQMTLTVSKTTFLPLEAEMEMTLKNFTTRIPTTIQFSNYQQVNGVSMPFEIDVQPSKQASFKIILQSVQWNTGLTDADFNPK